jgi:hypothetical protein
MIWFDVVGVVVGIVTFCDFKMVDMVSRDGIITALRALQPWSVRWIS